ncbi:MAG TPA: hypothetical protein PLY05_05095 [Agitococcus sp.]|nr:hypothetical protein [Agitococcus sp.]
MHALCLPFVSGDLPANFSAISLTLDTAIHSLSAAKTLLAQQTQPSYIAFSPKTPNLLVLACQQLWPDARYLLQEEQAWLELPSGEYWTTTNDNTTTESTEPVLDTVSPQEPTESTPPQVQVFPSTTTINTNSPKSDNYLLDKVFKLASWGENIPENRAQLDELFVELLKRSERNPRLIKRAQKKRDLGALAAKVWIEAEKRLKSTGYTAEFEAWFNQQVNNADGSTAFFLKNKLQKWQTWYRQRKQKFQTNAICTLPELRFSDHHPNSLRHLTPHHHWHILIDETGSEFDNSKQNISDKTLGRMVALAIPYDKVSLPTLKKNFHATSESDALLDKTIKTLLDNPVGIVGITVNDDLLGKSSRWFSGIYMLMRLVLRLLPIQGGQGKVEFFIEQRGGFDAQMSLLPIQQLLETELHALDKERFQHISLILQFSDKNHHPANGYVDAVAHMWAAGSANSKTRLKHSALKGHCLLEPHHDVIDRTYAAIDQKLDLSAKDWYQLVSSISHEPSSSLLHSVLQQLGRQTQQQADIWHRYLDYISQLLKDKNYRLLPLKSALDWLASYAPKTLSLPPMLTLHWYMARLACANHLGKSDISLIEKSLVLGSQLLEENAPDVCHLHLRIAVAATNLFEFNAAQQVLDFWKDQAPRVMGLANYGKYLSSLGQIAAFKGNLSQAITYFDQALETFAQLSDKKDKAKQQQQTQIYRLIAFMDMPEHSDSQVKAQLEQFFMNTLDKVAQRLSMGDDNSRFEHHVLLRAMITRPALFEESYLNNASEWQLGDAHPWPLICAYRAWLLHAKNPNQAVLWMQRAISMCQNEGTTLKWMAEVLTVMAQKQGIDAAHSIDLSDLKNELVHAPWLALQALQQANTPQTIHKAFVDCLPFNFH